jgi:hypothetical protein
MSYYPNRFACSNRNLLCCKPFVIDQFNRAPLAGLEAPQGLLDKYGSFG